MSRLKIEAKETYFDLMYGGNMELSSKLEPKDVIVKISDNTGVVIETSLDNLVRKYVSWDDDYDRE